LVHHGDRARSGENGDTGEAFDQFAGAEPVVPVPMRDEDLPQLPAGAGHPVADAGDLGER
jgi:hypothetical protein